MSIDESVKSESGTEQDKPRSGWDIGREQILERLEKVALAGYRIHTDNGMEVYKKVLEAATESDMPNLAFMATHKAAANAKAQAYFNMAEACRTIREKNEMGKGGEVGAIIRHGEPERSEPGQDDQGGNDNRSGSVDG